MSKILAGFFRDEEGVIHRVTGAKVQDLTADGRDWWISWQVFALCGRERQRNDKDPSTAVLQVTCMGCIARTTS